LKIGIISDIHGNLYALEAVLSELDRDGVCRIICLGDVAVGGPQPREVLERLRGLDASLVMGNTDEWLLDPKPYPIRDADSVKVNEVELWAASQTSADELSFVGSFRTTVRVALGAGSSLLGFHGSPRSASDVMLPTTPDAELETMLAGAQASVLAGGHTHTQMLRRHGHALVVNPGSVGLPYERDPVTGEVSRPPWAEYAVLESAAGGFAVGFRRLAYDVEPLFETARASGMPHAEWWVRAWSQPAT
jgi:predicted phosphodiesterase